MADRSKTPSPISSVQDSYRPVYDSHESLGYLKARRRTYSLANSVSGAPAESGPDAVHEEEEATDTGALFSGVNASSDPAYNSAADMSLTSIALGDDRAKSINTTQILQRALDTQPNWDSEFEALTIFPPHGESHANYYKHVQNWPDEMSAYTQVLIWCLARRIEHLRKAPPERLTMILKDVLQDLMHKLQARAVTPTTAYREPLRLKPKMANPANESYLMMIDGLKAAYDKVHETTRESYNIAGEFEKLGFVEGAKPVFIDTPKDGFEEVLETSSAEARHKTSALLERVTHLDGLSLQARERIYETVELRERLRVMEIEDPVAVLRATEFQEEY